MALRLLSALLAQRRNENLLKVPPYLSAACIVIGIVWLLLLPLNEYSRETYVSENALLPGQVHTYFGGSEHNIFRAYRHEVAGLVEKTPDERIQKLSDLLKGTGLKVATQKYTYASCGRNISGENVYAILQGPRADATEAIVLVGAWTTMSGEINHSGVALVLTMAPYFQRWSLWSKDIIFLISGDPTAGPQAWVDAYHDYHSPGTVEPLTIKSGALQGAIAVEYPAGPWGHRFDKLHILYDGVNGQLSNLDLFNTAVSIASGQMGIGCALQRMWAHDDTYQERLQTMLRGMLSQGLGHSSGPHSSFIPYHVDAITLQTVGDGWHDEMSLGRTVESLFRSLNNLLEHLHQSFFFYLLMQANRFVSIGTYLPSAMLIAVNFTITSIALWVQSGQPRSPSSSPITPIKPEPKKILKLKPEEKEFSDPAPTPKTFEIIERKLFLPLAFVGGVHFFGLLPLYVFNNSSQKNLQTTFLATAVGTLLLPHLTAAMLSRISRPSAQETVLIQCFSLLLLGLFLSALATLNFSLSFLVGVLAAPLSFVRAKTPHLAINVILSILLGLVNPLVVIYGVTQYFRADLVGVLMQAADGWHVWGMWTQVVVWLVWWPAWFAGVVVLSVGLHQK